MRPQSAPQPATPNDGCREGLTAWSGSIASRSDGHMDRLTPEQRSALMSRVRGRDTAPEMAVRKLAHAMGFRYRLYAKDLPGHPDLVFPRLRKAIFVHGCFWHAHEGCKLFRVPSTRQEFWERKFAANCTRDERVLRELEARGWHVLVVWQCETKDPEALRSRIRSFLSDRPPGQKGAC